MKLFEQYKLKKMNRAIRFGNIFLDWNCAHNEIPAWGKIVVGLFVARPTDSCQSP
jgi:hypothetical protein